MTCVSYYPPGNLVITARKEIRSNESGVFDQDPLQAVSIANMEDGREELFTKTHCALIMNLGTLL